MKLTEAAVLCGKNSRRITKIEVRAGHIAGKKFLHVVALVGIDETVLVQPWNPQNEEECLDWATELAWALECPLWRESLVYTPFNSESNQAT